MKNWAEELDDTLRKKLKRAGLVKSGRLLNSIATEVNTDNGDMVMRTQMEDYGVALNERSPFLDESISELEAELEQGLEKQISKDIQQLTDKN